MLRILAKVSNLSDAYRSQLLKLDKLKKARKKSASLSLNAAKSFGRNVFHVRTSEYSVLLSVTDENHRFANCPARAI